MFCAAKGRKNGKSRKNTALPRVCWPLANVGTALWLNYIFNLSAGGALQAIKWQIKFSSGFYFICHSGACNFCIFLPSSQLPSPFFSMANVFLICVSLSDDLGALSWQIFGSGRGNMLNIS